MLMNALSKASLKASGHVNKVLLAKNGQKVDEYKLICLGITVFDGGIGRTGS